MIQGLKGAGDHTWATSAMNIGPDSQGPQLEKQLWEDSWPMADLGWLDAAAQNRLPLLETSRLHLLGHAFTLVILNL